MKIAENNPTIVGSNSPSNPMSASSKSLISTSKKVDFDLVVAGTCPHCGSLLGKEIRGRGAKNGR
jgi:hypothetical protein